MAFLERSASDLLIFPLDRAKMAAPRKNFKPFPDFLASEAAWGIHSFYPPTFSLQTNSLNSLDPEK